MGLMLFFFNHRILLKMHLRPSSRFSNIELTFTIQSEASMAKIKPDKSYICFFTAIVKRISQSLFTPIWRSYYKLKLIYNEMLVIKIIISVSNNENDLKNPLNFFPCLISIFFYFFPFLSILPIAWCFIS